MYFVQYDVRWINTIPFSLSALYSVRQSVHNKLILGG